MKLLSVLIIIVFTTSSAIRVPSSWPKKQSVKQTTDGSSEIDFKRRPDAVRTPKYHKNRKYVPYNTRHLNPKNQKNFKASPSADEWKPINPHFQTNSYGKTNNDFNLPFFKKTSPRPIRENPLTKNHRDDSTHEPHYEIIEEKHIHREKPFSKHEIPSNIPTRPIYPGPGKWAKKEIPHKPYIKPLQEEQHAEDEENPEGYETFNKNEQLFKKHQNRFRNNLQSLPTKHNLGPYLPQYEDSEEEIEETEAEFIPTKIYSQVRRSETESHHPKLEYDPRLKEVIKDSKIQTVYSEEGYEDTAYDHAGHEKNAEESEGDQEFEKEIEKEKALRNKNEDIDTASSQQQTVNTRKNNIVKTEETKTMSVKEQNNGSAIEIASEIKMLSNQDNEGSPEEFIKLFPKVYRYDKLESTRPKRFVNDFPNIAVDTDFIDQINHNIPQKPQPFRKIKYPYYNNPNIHPDSPLRYAEDLGNIPKKTGNEFAFYNQADQIQCDEIPENVNPIPPRIKNADSNPEDVEDASDTQELVKGPRLRNLGDKIDCFKLKYFGENPLDSPIFKEELIGPVTNIFQDFKINEKRGAYTPIINEIEKPKIRSEGIEKKVIIQLTKPKTSAIEATTIKNLPNIEIISTTKTDNNLENNQTESDVVSIITTPKYTIDLKPKHIYHQIQLLEFLPPYDPIEEVTTQTPLILPSTVTPSSERFPKNLVNTGPEILEINDPKSEALRKRRLRPRPWYRPTRYNIFDINRFLPSNPYKYLDEQSSTISPQHDILSEVHYKDEIKPSEQFAVFTDVINIIKNSTKDSAPAETSNNLVPTKLNQFDKFKHKSFGPSIFHQYKNVGNSGNFGNSGNAISSYLPTSTSKPLTTSKPLRGTVKYTSPQNDPEDPIHGKERKKFENLELLKIKRKETNSYSATNPQFVEDSTASATNVKETEENSEVFGLMPPGSYKYKTIYHPQPAKSLVEAPPETVVEMNTFYVLGMKPPPLKQKALVYSDFKTAVFGKTKYPYLQRHRRSAQRPAYSEVSRNRNKPIDAEEVADIVVEEKDDYVPHRPKNYHYDEKTGRIVYDNVEKEEQPEEENVEYIEVTEAPLPKPTRKNAPATPKFANFTGPSYIDFVKKLKDHPSYETITDPTTTEKDKEEITTGASTTTAKPKSTTPPAFLSILSKVREDSNYKLIEDEKTKKSTTTTEETIIQEEEEEVKPELENVQNSPGSQNQMQNFQIFDINDYLPKIKNYSPRTSIDYSKYKTIQRPTTQRSLIDENNNSSSNSSKEINPIVSESKQEVVSSSTTEAPQTTPGSKKPNRRRGTRRPSSRTTNAPVVNEETNAQEILSKKNDKPKRTYPRRQRTRIKIETTTEESDLDIDETTKIVKRRHPRIEDIPPIKPRNDLMNSTETKPIQKARKIEDVQVFQRFEENKKHGGNYKRENKRNKAKKPEEVTRLTDVVAKPSSYFTDTKLSSNVNQLKEVETEDEVLDSHEDGKDYSVYDDEEIEEVIVTTKRPRFIKDPDKRLYYYAPI